MQNGKTSSPDRRPNGRGLVPALKNNGTLPPTDANRRQMATFDPLEEFVFSMQDPNAATRDKVAAAARDVFGGGTETTELVANLAEHMMAVSESRAKVVSE